MNMLTLNIYPSPKNHGKFLVEIDADRLERLASVLGLYNPDFLESLARAEADEKAGRVKKLKSLKDLR